MRTREPASGTIVRASGRQAMFCSSTGSFLCRQVQRLGYSYSCYIASKLPDMADSSLHKFWIRKHACYVFHQRPNYSHKSAVIRGLWDYSPLGQVYNQARQTRFIVSHQHPLPLRPAASTVVITFQTMTHPLLMAIVS